MRRPFWQNSLISVNSYPKLRSLEPRKGLKDRTSLKFILEPYALSWYFIIYPNLNSLPLAATFDKNFRLSVYFSSITEVNWIRKEWKWMITIVNNIRGVYTSIIIKKNNYLNKNQRPWATISPYLWPKTGGLLTSKLMHMSENH